jgi:hypothetical protein
LWIIYAVIAALRLRRNAGSPVAVNWRVDCTFEIHCAVVAKADRGVAFKAFAWFSGIKFDYASRRVATEQRALRAAQNFNLIHVEYRKTFQYRIFLNDVVVYQTDRLRCIQIEVGVAQTADIKARKERPKSDSMFRLGVRADRKRMSWPDAV